MDYPSFYDAVPSIVVHDPLAELLGAVSGGRIEYRYLDVVKLAGHSCPTAAGAFLMLWRGLAALYPDRLPERGAILSALRAGKTDGAAGVMGKIVGLVTGAAQEEGFKGLGGRFDRRNLLVFGAAIPGDLRLARDDTGNSVDLKFTPSAVPASSESSALTQRALSSGATDDERRLFAQAWQGRVRKILVDQRDNPNLVTILPPVP